MENLLKNKLIDGFRSGILKDNRLAAVLLNIVDSGKFFSASRRDLAADLISSEMPEDYIGRILESKEKSGNKFCDLRMLGISLSGIKKYPVRLDGLGFGLSFSKGSIPINSVFVGSNGVGKTSVYAALEYGGMRKLNTAAGRGYKRKIGQAADKDKTPEKDQGEFLIHTGNDIKDARLLLLTNDQIISLEGEEIIKEAANPLVPEVFYCSDYDVRELESNDDYTRFLLRQIGLNHFYYALQLLYYLRVYVNKENKKQEEAKLWKVDSHKGEEPIRRLLLGIVLGNLKFEIPSDERYSEIEGLTTALKSGESKTLVKNYTDKILKWSKEEQACFSSTEWISIEVHNKYEKFIDILSQIKSKDYLLRGGKKNKILDKLREFLKFRKSLYDDITEYQGTLGDTPSSDFRLRFIKDIVGSLSDAGQNPDSLDIERLFSSTEEEKKFEEEYSKLVTYLEEYLAQILTEWKEKITKSIDSLLLDYFDIDNDSIKVNLEINPTNGSLDQSDVISGDMEYDEIYQFVNFNIQVLTAHGNLNANQREGINPRQYLNTFRFKLFCVALKTALSCFVKEKYNLNYPLIIDDVFESSDFDSRLRLKNFVEKIVSCHDELLPSEKFELQIIFFSQDDLIAEQIYKGLIVSKGTQKVKFSRIYDYHEAVDTDKRLFDIRTLHSLHEQSSDGENNINEESNKYDYISLEDGIGNKKDSNV